MKEKILARERDCFEFLKAIPANRKFVLVGGYAVSSFEFPRLSVDLDIVIPEEELKFFRDFIKEQGFVFSEEKSDFDLTYRGRFEKYTKGGDLPISVDLLINSVQARQTNYPYSFEYILKNSEVKEIRGWDPSSRVQIRVANREMLIALKANSMRAADKRDIVMLCYERPNVKEIVAHLKNCPRGTILKNIDELLELLSDPRYKDAIKGVFTISDEVLKMAIGNCIETFNEIKKKLT